MMGTKERRFAPLINVSVEQLVPQDHFYRHVERTLDPSFVREFVQTTYASGGRPSIDPIVFFKLQLVTRYGLGVFRRFFEAIVQQCQEAGLVWGQELYMDGTKVAANAGKESVKPRFAVEEHLNRLFDTQTEEPGDEEEQQQAAQESTPDAHEELAAPRALPTSLTSKEY